VALALALVAGSMVANGRAVLDAGYGLVPLAADTAYWLVVLGMGTAALYGSARLAQVVDELRVARQEVVELAVGRERLRVSRDLHDLLGQSLSAVSLKGDLALRLLATDGEAARAEIEGLTDVARGALRDVRAVARDEHAVSLRAEVDAAAALLGAAGVDVRTDLAVGHLPAGVEQVLAWAVREGATNALRHAEATTWDVTATVVPGTAVTLEMVNDGARGPERPHGGLDGLAERARELAGTVAAGPEPGGRFRLAVTVPTRPAAPVPAGPTDREHA
jgi:two-component system sensor histidine kinase DesK